MCGGIPLLPHVPSWRVEGEILPSSVRSQNCEKLVLPSSFPSVCLSLFPSAWNKLAPTGRIFVKFDIYVFFENLWLKLKFH